MTKWMKPNKLEGAGPLHNTRHIWTISCDFYPCEEDLTKESHDLNDLTISDREGTKLLVDDIIEYSGAEGDLFVVSRKQDWSGIEPFRVRVHKLNYPFEIYYLRPGMLRLVERQPTFRR